MDVTVVIPSRDRCAPLERCLASLLVQTRPAREIIVVDDDSGDGTAAMLDDFAQRHPEARLRVLRNESRAGTNGSRNRAVRAATGELVAFLDSDCTAEPGWLAALTAPFAAPGVAATTGRVTVPPPANVYELTYRGTNRVPGRGTARRLVACNMCIRRRLLLEFPLDEDLAYGCDEEGIHLRLRAAGYDQRVVPGAVVCHHHRFDRGALFRHALVGGGAAAWFVYKYRLPTRLDVAPFLLAYATLPLALFRGWLAVVPLACLAAALAALTYNELARKGKTVGQVMRCLPVLLAYYQVRLAGYVARAVRLRLERDVERVDLKALSARAAGT